MVRLVTNGRWRLREEDNTSFSQPSYKAISPLYYFHWSWLHRYKSSSNFIFGHWCVCTTDCSLYTLQCLSIAGHIVHFGVASVRTNIKTQIMMDYISFLRSFVGRCRLRAGSDRRLHGWRNAQLLVGSRYRSSICTVDGAVSLVVIFLHMR